MTIKAPYSGVITQLFVQENEKLDVGQNFIEIDTSATVVNFLYDCRKMRKMREKKKNQILKRKSQNKKNRKQKRKNQKKNPLLKRKSQNKKNRKQKRKNQNKKNRKQKRKSLKKKNQKLKRKSLKKNKVLEKKNLK